MIEVLAGMLGSVVLLSGLALATIGLYGMLTHADVFEQLHAAGLVTGPAVILVLLASLVSGSAEMLTSAVLVVAFILVTSSISTHVVALAAWRQREVTPAAAMRLVIAHDGSPGSDTALSLVGSMRWPDGTVARVVGVTEGDVALLSGAAVDGPAWSNGAPGRLAAEVAAAARHLERPGLTVEHVIRGGDPASTLADEADAIGADLVVVGSRGLGSVRSMISGSVAAGVLDRARCSVLVARGTRLDRALLAADGSDGSTAAIRAAADWPAFEGVAIGVLTVASAIPRYREVPPVRVMREAVAMSRHRNVAERVARELRDAGRSAVPYVRSGEPAGRIMAVAEAQSADLIVLGSRGRSGVTRAVLGSVGYEVLTTATASVLVVRTRR